ncbi:DNA polymerase III subunit delta [Fulvimarina sp. 2208YS6-2-32]|uniref:DNA-directed DNA polymerase n=1 Tax=Fulvimarina uroteuthidis TaxID=3098149 RepID=A0ABU5I113_9HYPH|nr:DNA polymerase III subunit delta [Fulvimarina sp. 2208YS6-2-32]MDY8109079.1 DNA polymerase III subunit delta [Fulvimarina sp. 2208YS6-2-32]
MAQKKAGEVDAFLSRPDFSYPVILLYGPDPGLVSERAHTIAKQSGVDASDPFASVTLAADDLEKDIGRLYDEALTVSMFGGKRLIRIRGAGNGKALGEAVVDLSARKLEGAILIIEAGELKKNSGLRLGVERAKYALALPCYQDEARALDRMIDEELNRSGLQIDREGRDELKSRLGANRLASRGEVEKLCVYAYGTDKITAADVAVIVGDVSADAVEEAIDAAISGAVKKLPALIERLTDAGTPVYQLQQTLLRTIQQLQAMRESVERNGEPVARVIERRRPHFKRKPALETALGAWPLEALSRTGRRIEADILKSRKENQMALTITRQMMLSIAVEAALHRRR